MTRFPQLDLLEVEGASLGSHVNSCRAAHGRMFRVSCIAESAHAFLMPRFVTTLAVATLALLTLAALG